MPAKQGQGHPDPAKRPRRAPAKFPAVSQELREWSAMLGLEMDGWPEISSTPMFGFISYYRANKIFAALPKTRGLHNSSSFILKFNPMPPVLQKRAESDERIDTHTRLPGKGWFSFELSSESDLHHALYWLNQAMKHPRKKPRNRQFLVGHARAETCPRPEAVR